MFDLEKNKGPSQLALGRMAADEIERIDSPELAAFEQEVAADPLPAFDWVVLQAASHRVVDPVVKKASAAPWWKNWAAMLTPVALALGVFLLVTPPDEGTNRTKGQVDLDFFVQVDSEIRPGLENEPLAEGDRIQFTYRADGLDTLVLVSVDGDGALTVFYPEEGDTPVGVIPGDRHLLEGSVELDDVAGPEVFVAVFGTATVADAVALVEQAFSAGGHQALRELPGHDTAIDVVVIEKVP